MRESESERGRDWTRAGERRVAVQMQKGVGVGEEKEEEDGGMREWM